MEVAWLGVYPALPIQLAKLGGGGRECSHATSERFFNSYVLVTGGGREKGCSLATSERFFNSYVLVTGEEGEKGCSLATSERFFNSYVLVTGRENDGNINYSIDYWCLFTSIQAGVLTITSTVQR